MKKKRLVAYDGLTNIDLIDDDDPKNMGLQLIYNNREHGWWRDSLKHNQYGPSFRGTRPAWSLQDLVLFSV